jgi:molecular chaperone IbpA
MTKLQLPGLFDFHKFDPFAVGYEDMFKDLQDMAKTVAKTVSYPPYNIKQIKDNKFVIEIAVAGFGKLDTENFIFKGIANRNFSREFKLNDKIEIENAEMTNGMLKIWLANMVKGQDAIKKIVVKEKDEK